MPAEATATGTSPSPLSEQSVSSPLLWLGSLLPSKPPVEATSPVLVLLARMPAPRLPEFPLSGPYAQEGWDPGHLTTVTVRPLRGWHVPSELVWRWLFETYVFLQQVLKHIYFPSSSPSKKIRRLNERTFYNH